MIKVIKLSCTFSMVLWIKYKKCLFLTTKSISKRMYCDIRGKISNLLDPVSLAHHGSDYSFLHFKYFCAMGWVTPKGYAISYDCIEMGIVNIFQSINWHNWFDTPHYVIRWTQFWDNIFNMTTPVYRILQIYAQKFNVSYRCFWIII